MKEQLTKLVNLCKKKDFAALGYLLLSVIPDTIFKYDQFYFIKSEKIPETFLNVTVCSGMNVRIVDYSRKELDKIKKHLDIDEAIISFQSQKREEHTKIIVIVNHEGVPVAVSFTTKVRKLRSPSGYTFDLGENTYGTWSYGNYVHPDYRRRGALGLLMVTAHKLSRQEGRNTLYLEIHYLNRSSLAAHERVGFSIFKHIHYVKLFQKKYYFERRKT